MGAHLGDDVGRVDMSDVPFGAAVAAKASWWWWLRFARHPVFATLANALGVFAGLLGALYTEDIRNATPFQWTQWHTLSLHALVFWVCFLVFAFTFLSREWAVDKVRESSEQKLEDTIRTMPPRGFVVEFAQYFGQCHKAVKALDLIASPSRDQIARVARMLLSSVAHLARKYDAAQGATYAANVMIYWETVAHWQKYMGTVEVPDVKFAEAEAALDRIPLLIIDRLLSATTGSGNIDDPDPVLTTIPNLALPVPGQSRNGRSDDGKRWRVLPGAPLTYFTKEPNSYEDTSALGSWCRERGDFSESVSLQVESYFGQDNVRNVIGSFASIPIKSSANTMPIGVVNLHCNSTGILRDPGAPSQFFPLIEPFTTLLADTMLRLLNTAK